MKAKIFAAALALALAAPGGVVPAPAAEAQTRVAFLGSLAGSWKGAYLARGGIEMVPFDVQLRQSRQIVEGRIFEPNSASSADGALILTSTFKGRFNGQVLSFTKTYDGSGGFTHTVEYSGRITPDGRRIRGEYALGGVASGTFEMVR